MSGARSPVTIILQQVANVIWLILGSKRIAVESNSACKTEKDEVEAECITADPPEQGLSQSPCCHVTLTTYSVKKSIINFPVHFVKETDLGYRRCEVTIIDREGKPWTMNLNYKNCDGRSYIKIGWKDFQTAHGLKAGNVVYFELKEAGKQPILKCYRVRR